MNVFIVGAGKVGYYLVKTLLPNKHRITIIEKSQEYCNKLAADLEVAVLHGDGTDINLLSEAGTQHADVFIAVTGTDQDNLIACQLAGNFHVKRTIARSTIPEHCRDGKTELTFGFQYLHHCRDDRERDRFSAVKTAGKKSDLIISEVFFQKSCMQQEDNGYEAPERDYSDVGYQ